MSPQSTDAVQMYYVSEGMPVAVGSSPKLQNAFQALPQDHTSAGKPLPSPPTYRNTSTYQTYQKSDSLESLLSLNVLAAQLLTDHDDLQGVDSRE